MERKKVEKRERNRGYIEELIKEEMINVELDFWDTTGVFWGPTYEKTLGVLEVQSCQDEYVQ